MQNMIDSVRQAELEAEAMERDTAAQCAKLLSDAKEEAKALLLHKNKEATALAENRLSAAAAQKDRHEALAAEDAASLKAELYAAAEAKEAQAIDHILSRIF